MPNLKRFYVSVPRVFTRLVAVSSWARVPEGQRWKAKLSERGAKCKAKLKTENLANAFKSGS